MQNVQECLKEYGADPFDLTNTTLRTLHSGEVATKELVDDFATYLHDGEIELSSFFSERIFSREVMFNATVHRNNRRSFSKPPTSEKCNSKKMKTAAMENQAMASVVTMCCQDQAIPLVEVMKYRITEESLPIFNPNGTMQW